MFSTPYLNVQIRSGEQAALAAGFHISGRQKYKHGKDRSKKPPDYEKDSSVNSVAGEKQL